MEKQKASRVYLVGFMGVGKSTIGKMLANKMGVEFIDLDDLFETKYKVSIHVFFEKYGETLFRELEYKLLNETTHLKNVVISTGGGTACFFDAMELMNAKGTTVYLKMEPSDLVLRLKKAKRKRPHVLNKNEDELIKMVNKKLKERQGFYLKANVIVDSLNIDIDKLSTQLTEI